MNSGNEAPHGAPLPFAEPVFLPRAQGVRGWKPRGDRAFSQEGRARKEGDAWPGLLGSG